MKTLLELRIIRNDITCIYINNYKTIILTRIVQIKITDYLSLCNTWGRKSIHTFNTLHKLLHQDYIIQDY